MAKTHLKDTEEERGRVPGCTGALLEIVGIERGKTGENAKTPGLRRYVPTFKVMEPKKLAGMTVRDFRITIGTPEDPLAKKAETWDRSEGGPARLKRLLTRSGTPISDDDEEWMEAAEGNQVVAPLEESEGFPTSPGLYYRPSDEDAPEIGLADGTAKGARGAKTKGAAAASKRARGRHVEEAEEDEVDAAEEDEDDEDEPKKGKSTKKADDEDEDEEEEEPPAKKAHARGGKKKVEEDEEDDD